MFVCMGNICRSPLAEGVFRQLVEDAGLEEQFEVASSGTGGWHVGQSPDRRMQQVARKNGVSLEGQRARQFHKEDLTHFDFVFAMDRDNLEDITDMAAQNPTTAQVHLFRNFDPDPGDGNVPDPYYGGARGFDLVFDIVSRTTQHILDSIQENRPDR